MTDVIRYSVKCGTDELAAFTTRLAAVEFARKFSREHGIICHVVDNGGKFKSLAYSDGFAALDDDDV